MHFIDLIEHENQKWKRAIIAFVVVLFLLSLVYLMVGEVVIAPWHIPTEFEWQLMTQLRIPRLFIAITIGAALSVSGATLQVLLGNPLAEPGIVGVSGGASVAMVVILFFFPEMGTPLIFMFGAVIGAMAFTLILVSIAKMMNLSTARLLLIGVALGILSSSVVTWAFYFSDDLSLRQLMYWLMGGIGGASWQQYWLVAIMLPVMLWLASQGRLLDKLMLGEIQAMQMGVDVHRSRYKLIIALSILVGGAVALGGMIGFVGLVVPHLIRIVWGSQNRFLVPLSMIAGASLLVFSDLLARILLESSELPLGVVTTTIGAPIFIWLLLKNYDLR